MADMCTITWDVLPADLFEEITSAYSEEIVFLVTATIMDMESEIVEWMKSNAPWKDITGDARSGLTAITDIIDTDIVMTLGHLVYYGTYLEGWNPKTNAPMLNAGQWSILEPTIDYWGPIILERIRQKFGVTYGRSD